MNLVIVAAAKFELEPLVNGLQGRGLTPHAQLVGVGSINAAKNARMTADACRGAHVVFVGTCGTFSEFKKVSLVSANKVVWKPTSVRSGLAYTVENTAPDIPLKKSPSWLEPLPQKTVVCGPAISVISTLSDDLRPDSSVENLELYSCIQEIQQTAQSVSVVLAITNTIGPDSHSQWRTNFAEAAGMTAEFITANLKL